MLLELVEGTHTHRCTHTYSVVLEHSLLYWSVGVLLFTEDSNNKATEPALEDDTYDGRGSRQDQTETKKKSLPRSPPDPDDGDTTTTAVNKLTRDIEQSYQQLVASLDQQKDGDPTVTALKDSITSKYAQFDRLRQRRAMEETVAKQWTEGGCTSLVLVSSC